MNKETILASMPEALREDYRKRALDGEWDARIMVEMAEPFSKLILDYQAQMEQVCKLQPPERDVEGKRLVESFITPMISVIAEEILILGIANGAGKTGPTGQLAMKMLICAIGEQAQRLFDKKYDPARSGMEGLGELASLLGLGKGGLK